MVEPQPSKLVTRVRFPSPALKRRAGADLTYHGILLIRAHIAQLVRARPW